MLYIADFVYAFFYKVCKGWVTKSARYLLEWVRFFFISLAVVFKCVFLRKGYLGVCLCVMGRYFGKER